LLRCESGVKDGPTSQGLMAMNIKRKKGWEIPESAATPEAAR
jgi:hypothetical protein